MDQGLSLFNPSSSLNFDLQNIGTTHNEEDEAAEDAKRKEKELQDALATAFDDLIEEEDDDNEEAQYSHISQYNSQMIDEHSGGSRFYQLSHSQLSSDTNSRVSSSTPDRQTSVYSQDKEYYIDDARHAKETISSLHYEEPETAALKSYYSAAAQAISNRFDHFSTSDHETEVKGNDNIEGNITIKQVQMNSTYNNFLGPTAIQNLVENTPSAALDHDINFGESKPNGINEPLMFGSTESYPVEQYKTPSLLSDGQKKNEEEFIQLQVLYKARGNELQRVKEEVNKMREESERDVRILKHQLALIEGEKEGLTYSLQQSQQLVSDKNRENSTLQGKFTASELQLSAERDAKEEIIKKLEGAETTIQSLEQQITDLCHSENLVRAREQHESIVSNLKLRHQQESLELKEEIDALRQQLSTKTEETEMLQHQNHLLEQKLQQLQIAKAEIVNHLTANLEASQRQCQNLLESGTISEVSNLKMKMHHIESEKAELQNENKSLKEEISSLHSEFKSYETVCKLQFLSDGPTGDDSVIQLGLRKRDFKRKNEPDNLLASLQTELERSVNASRSQRSQNASLRNKLSAVQQELIIWTDKAKMLEDKFGAAENKANELQKKVDELSPTRSVPVIQYQKEVSLLKNENNRLEFQLQDIQTRLKEISESEEHLNELNRQLRLEMSTMIKENDEDKHMALQRCRESCLQLHQDAMERMKQELTSNAECEIKKLHDDYENKLIALNKENEFLNEALHEVKTQYISLSEETKVLHANLEKEKNFRNAKNQKVGERMQEEYEIQLQSLKEKLNKEKEQWFHIILRKELSKAQEEWAKQKVKDVEDFISEVKQQLDAEFQTCLQKEKHRLEKEKEQLVSNYSKKVQELEEQYSKDKESALQNLNKTLTTQWEREITDLKKLHQSELQNIKGELEHKLQEIESYKNKLTSDTNLAVIVTEKLLEDKDSSNDKDAWEKEKETLINNESLLKEKISTAWKTEERLRERLKKYQKYINLMTKKHLEEISKIKSQMTEQVLTTNAEQETQFQQLKTQHSLEILNIEKTFSKVKNELYNTETADSYCQTDEAVISKICLNDIQDMFLFSLKKITGEINIYLNESAKRNADRLQRTLLRYHHQVMKSIVLQNITTDNQTKISSPHFQTGITTIATNMVNVEEINSNAVQHSAKHDFDPINVTICKTILPSIHSWMNGEEMSEYSDLFDEKVRNETQLLPVQNADVGSWVGIEDNSKILAERSGISEDSTEFMSLPQQKSAVNLLTQAFKLPNNDMPPGVLCHDWRNALSNFLPERLSPDRQSSNCNNQPAHHK